VKVTMPQLGETVAEATITRWLKQVGDPVEEGEPLFEVTTDKAEMEIPATASGTLESISAAEDETVAVGSVIAIIGGSGPAPQPPLTPAVRHLLEQHGLAAADVVGSGPHGRITREDVLNSAKARPTPSARVADEPRAVPFTAIRRLTAERTTRSKAISPHTLMVVEVDYTAVDRVRSRAGADGSGLTYLPFLARAVVDAIGQFPHVNASVGDGELLIHPHVNLGIAVDLDGEGLVVPVVRNADTKPLRAIAGEIAELSRAARQKTASPDQFAGGTFTISNPGPYGTLLTGAIINQPEVAILATDAVRPRPVAVPVDDGYAVAVRPIGNLALTFDHRAVDGGYAARFLRALKDIVEQRDWSAELTEGTAT